MEEFSDHWKIFTGLYLEAQSDVKQYVLFCIQAHRTGESLNPFLTAPYDGIAKLCFDKMGDISMVLGTANYLKNIAPDKAKFIDRDNIQ